MLNYTSKWIAEPVRPATASCLCTVFASCSPSPVTLSALAWLYPPGPSEFVRLNFEALSSEPCSLFSLGFLEHADLNRMFFFLLCLNQIHKLPRQWRILMHLPSLPVLRPRIRIIRCAQTSGTLRDADTYDCSFHVLASVLFVSQRAAASGQLCSPQHCKIKAEKKDSPPLWLIKHEHSAAPQLASPVHPPHSPSFAFLLTQSVTVSPDSSRWVDESYANVTCL